MKGQFSVQGIDKSKQGVLKVILATEQAQPKQFDSQSNRSPYTHIFSGLLNNIRTGKVPQNKKISHESETGTKCNT